MKYLLTGLLLISSAFARESFLDQVERMKWNMGNGQELDVVWIEDDKFPRFTASVYFQDGALNDAIPGTTQTAFDLLTSGTKKESQRDIAEFFDFYGASLRHSITHEYSVFTVQALTKDIKPVMGKVCELFNDSNYPKDKLDSHVSRVKSHLKNLVTNHSKLADLVFRRISLSNTPYAEPVEGTIKSLDKMAPELLKDRLNALNKTKKVLYLAGPSDVKQIQKILSNDCKWTNETKASRAEFQSVPDQSSIYLVTVPNANQAQIRIGRYLKKNEFENRNTHYYFLSGFLGGGFTSKLVQELRVKRGLTYSAGAYVSMQRDYGRAGLVTFSKNETTAETISIIRDVLSEVTNGKFEQKEFLHQKNHQIGGYAFNFEETSAFLAQLMLYDHQERDYKELAEFPENIGKLSMTDLSAANLQAFPWNKQTIVVVGDKSLVKSLSRIRPVKVINFEDYL